MIFTKLKSPLKLLTVLVMVSAFTLSCGKKTDPISKDSLERAGLPEKVIVAADSEGVLITNNEDAFVLIEKAVMVGDNCSEYARLTIIDPKEKFLDKDVSKDTRYSYRLTAKTIKYGLISESMLRLVTYSPPPQVMSAVYKDGVLEIVPSAEFVRMDVFSNGESIAQTGRNLVNLPEEGLADNISIVLADRYSNKGAEYPLVIKPAEKKVIPPVTELGAALFAKDLRIFWNSSKDASGYEIEVCENASCETFTTQFPYIAYQKEFDKCLDIAVYATSGEAQSAPSIMKFCK